MAQTPEGKVKSWLYGDRKKPGKLFDYFPGAFVYKPPGGMFGRGGMSDCLMCWRGVFVAIEIKASYEDGGSDVTALQLKTLREVNAAGGVGAVLRGRSFDRLAAIKEAVLKKIEEMKDGTQSTV